MDQPSYTKQLLMQLNQQRSAGHLCDVVIVVEDALFRAHKNVLAACSSYFRCLVLQDNLIALNAEMVKASVFKQVLDFIYTGQLHHAGDQGVSDLLRAASYLQLSDLAALCRRKLKPYGSSDWSSSTTSSLTTNGRLQVGYRYHSGSLEGEDLSEEELFTAQHVNSSSAAFYNQRLEHVGEQRHQSSQQTAAYKRPRSGWEGRLEGSVQTKRQEVESGELVREEDSVLKNQLLNSQEEEHASYVHHQPQPGFQPALHNKLYMCVPCGKGFPSSEQLIAHVHSHTAEELSIKVEYAEGGTLIKIEDSQILPSQPVTEETKPDATPPRHVCLVCSRSYLDAALLRQHERSHRLNRPFSCNICGKPFTQRGTMTRHMRSHLGLKPFECEECGMRFTRHYRKTEHMRTHSREKTSECQLCGEKFTHRRSFFSHLKMHTTVS